MLCSVAQISLYLHLNLNYWVGSKFAGDTQGHSPKDAYIVHKCLHFSKHTHYYATVDVCNSIVGLFITFIIFSH